MGELINKKAVVTGAGRGIGRCIAIKLAEEGADLAVLYHKRPEPVAELKLEIEGMGRECHLFQCEETANNIRINIVSPGLVETDMGRSLTGVKDMRELYDKLPFGRACQPDDIANAVLYLVTDAGSYIQGEAIYINGGLMSM